MKCKLWVLLFLFLIAEPSWASTGGDDADEPPPPKHFFNAYTLEQAGQADLSLFGVSRISILSGTEIQANLKENLQSWQLSADGTYHRLHPEDGREPFGAHNYFINNPSLSGRGRALKYQPPPRMPLSLDGP